MRNHSGSLPIDQRKDRKALIRGELLGWYIINDDKEGDWRLRENEEPAGFEESYKSTTRAMSLPDKRTITIR